MQAQAPRILGCLLLIAAGCGGGSGTKVTGKVTHAGAPVTGGNIVFEPLTGGGRSVSSTIKADGTYEAPGVAAGDYKVTVSTEHLKSTASSTPKLPGGIQAPPSSAQMNGLTYVKIDLKYSQVATTDLKATVAGGSQTHDFDLK